MKTTRVGIISENFEHDSKALKNLLQKRFERPDFEIFPIVKAAFGSKMKNLKRLKILIDREIAKKKIDFIIISNDLDGLPSESKKIKEKQEWYRKFQKYTTLPNNYFLAIYELEALILADIESFNKMYGTSIQFKKNSLYQPDPKGFLINKTLRSKRTYQENQTPEIFEELNFDAVYQNHKGEYSFQEFINELTNNFK